MDKLYVRLVYDDEQTAADWLVRAFGFTEVERKDNPGGSSIIWLELSGGTVMISRVGFGLQSPKDLGGVSHKMNVYVDDVDAHYARATAEGAVVERPLETVPYGERRYEAFDPGGHRWHFTQRL
jgi:uncharacterized glyoxalase superfamily protein PhnB